jgi:hypothetical protein
MMAHEKERSTMKIEVAGLSETGYDCLHPHPFQIIVILSFEAKYLLTALLNKLTNKFMKYLSCRAED